MKEQTNHIIAFIALVGLVVSGYYLLSFNHADTISPDMQEHQNLSTSPKELASKEAKINSYNDQESYVIGINYSKQGTAKNSALAIYRGVELAVEEINEKGGVLGKKVKIIELDHLGFPDGGKKNFKKFSSMNNILAVVGGMHSPVVLAERKNLSAQDPVYLIPWAAANPIIQEVANPKIFRISVRDQYAAPKLIKRSREYCKKTHVLLEKTGWGRSNHRIIQKLQNENEFSIGWFSWGESHFTQDLAEIKRNRSDCLIYVGNAPEAINLVQRLSSSNLHPRIFSHWGILGGDFYEKTKDIVSKFNINFIVTFTPQKDNPPLLFHRYLEKYQTGQSPLPAPFATVHSYDLVKFLSEAVSKSASVDPVLISENIRRIKNFSGAMKVYHDPFGGKLMEGLKKEDVKFGRFDTFGNIVEADVNE